MERRNAWHLWFLTSLFRWKADFSLLFSAALQVEMEDWKWRNK